MLKKKSLLIQNIDTDFQNDFQDLCNEGGYARSTANKFIQVIKSLCVDARQNGFILSSQFEAIKLKKEKNSVIYLNQNELNKTFNLNDSEIGQRLIRVKDWLITSCYTGQRVSDFLNFNERNIRKVDGVMLLDITQKKTKKYVTIPLLLEVIGLLNNYEGKFPETISG
ncbi:MAG: integrase [Sediminicola sp.]|jgi:integrase